MKTKLLFAVALFIASYNFAQTNGWYLYNKPSTIFAIVPDGTNADLLHLATDMGYIQYNTATDMVTDYLNLTSQAPAIGHVYGLALNPINNNVALALDGGFAIYNGTSVTLYDYNNSALTVGSAETSFTRLEVRYGRQGELYIFNPFTTGYQLFNAGAFDPEVVTTIRPQDIVENQAGTKVYFAGWNDGLHELTKATDTWVNYTTSNSDLLDNPYCLYVDSNDLLYIGGYKGLNTLTSAGVWNTYQRTVPPANVIFYHVHDISVNETTGDVLLLTSKPGNSYNGLTTLDLATNTWTNYTNDNTNCLNVDVFQSVSYGGDGMIYAAKDIDQYQGGSQLIKFSPATDMCTQLDLNYLNALGIVNSNVFGGFNVRKKASGNLEFGFTQYESLHMLEIDPTTFNGVFPNVTTITQAPGTYLYSLISDNDFFIAETNTGWVFVDGTNTATAFNHNIPNYLALTTIKAASYDSDDGIVNLVHKGYDASYNYRVYKTQCNTATAGCSAPEEIFTDNRDISQNIVFGANTNPATNQVNVVAVKTGLTSSTSKTKTNLSGTIQRTKVHYNGGTNEGAIIAWLEAHGAFPKSDPYGYEYTATNGNNRDISYYPNQDGKTLEVVEHEQASGTYMPQNFDIDNDGTNDKIKAMAHLYDITLGEGGDGNPFIDAMLMFGLSSGGSKIHRIDAISRDKSDPIGSSLHDTPLPSTTVTLPSDIIVKKMMLKKNSPTNALLVLLTDYGLLFKTSVDISPLTLSTNDVAANENNSFIYPNPATDRVSFSDKSINKTEVFDITGKFIMQSNTNSISIKTLSSGMYLVKGTNGNNVTITKKLLKK